MHEVGSVVEGKVTGITKFGAFVELEDGAVGMVHISEVSQSYVNDISEHLKEQQVVKVKVLSVSDDNKISLSIKKAMPPVPFVRKDGATSRPTGGFNNQNRQGGSAPRPQQSSNNSSGAPQFRPQQNNKVATTPKGPAAFEDMLTKFMSSSEDKISDMKKGMSNRRSGHQKHVTRDYD